MRLELDSAHEVFNRKLEQIARKYLRIDESGELEEAAIDSRNKDIFSRYSERIAGLLLNAGAAPDFDAGPPPYSVEAGELEERLSSLESEARRAIAKVKEHYADKARSIDEYLVHPNLKDIHFVRSCILWMPPQAA